MNKKNKDIKVATELPKLKPKFDFSPQSFTGGRSFKPSQGKATFNPGMVKTQHKG